MSVLCAAPIPLSTQSVYNVIQLLPLGAMLSNEALRHRSTALLMQLPFDSLSEVILLALSGFKWHLMAAASLQDPDTICALLSKIGSADGLLP